MLCSCVINLTVSASVVEVTFTNTLLSTSVLTSGFGTFVIQKQLCTDIKMAVMAFTEVHLNPVTFVFQERIDVYYDVRYHGYCRLHMCTNSLFGTREYLYQTVWYEYTYRIVDRKMQWPWSTSADSIGGTPCLSINKHLCSQQAFVLTSALHLAYFRMPLSKEKYLCREKERKDSELVLMTDEYHHYL